MVIPTLVLLREIHANRLANYDCKGSAPCQSQSGTGYRWTLAARRTGFRSNRRPDLSFFRNSTTSSSHIPCKERTPPTFLSPPSSLSPSTGSRAEQLRLPRSQRIVAAAVDSMLCTELADLEPQEYSPKRVLWYKPMSWLGVIRPHHRDESWSESLWQAFSSLLWVMGSVTHVETGKVGNILTKATTCVSTLTSMTLR